MCAGSFEPWQGVSKTGRCVSLPVLCAHLVWLTRLLAWDHEGGMCARKAQGSSKKPVPDWGPRLQG